MKFDPEHLRIAAEVRTKARRRRGFERAGGLPFLLITARTIMLKIGQMVDYRASTGISSAARGPYQITQRMPSEDGEYKYRIKSPNEAHERVADESELTGV